MKIPHEEIKRLRLQKNISQVNMADAAGMSRSAYIFFEKNGSENLPLKSAVGIAKTLDVPFNELFEIEDSTEWKREVVNKIEEYKKWIEKQSEFIISIKRWYLINFIRGYSILINTLESITGQVNDENIRAVILKLIKHTRENENFYLKKDIENNRYSLEEYKHTIQEFNRIHPEGKYIDLTEE